MPSPLAHTAMGYVIYRIYRPRLARHATPEQVGPLPRLFLITATLSLLPDLDVVPGILLGDLNRFHNNMTHSLFFGLVIALIVGGVVRLRQKTGFVNWFLITLLCYEFHVIMDYFTVGRGVMILWPFSPERYEPAIMLFYGLHRSDGLITIRHLWTLITEAGFALLVYVLVNSVCRYTHLCYITTSE